MTRIFMLAVALAMGGAGPAQGQPQPPDATIRSEKVADGIYVLFGDGGNVGVSIGQDGVFLIDDQYAPMAPAISAAVAGLGGGAPRFVLNTHWHGDHTGSNEHFGKAGAVIIAHDNVRARMSVAQAREFFKREVPASPPGALPIVTFSDTVTLNLNGDEIRTMHVAHAHTDGDAIVRFQAANVVHAGDIFFNGLYPFIDVDAGGSITGLMAAVDALLAMSDGDTRIIPGHGPIAGRAALEDYRKMLVETVGRVRALKAEGKSADEIVAAAPNADYDATWGANWFVSPELYVRLLYALIEAE